MKDYIAERVITIAEHILKTGATVRACAAKYHVSKTTVHKDMCERLPHLDEDLARSVGKVMQINKADRHIRGGEATRRKYRGVQEN